MSEHELWNELGNLYYLSGSYNQAIYAYNRSIQMENRFGRPYSNLALAYVQQGKYAEAVRLYQAGIERLLDNKEKAISWYRLGDAYRCLKDYRDAILAYQQGDLLDPSLSQDDKELGEVLYGPSELTSAPALPQLETPSPIVSASDSFEAAAPTPEMVGPMTVASVVPEPEVNETLLTAIEEPRANLESQAPPTAEEVSEVASTQDESQEPEMEEEFFSVLFEQEPVMQDTQEEEPSDWLFYFGSEVPEPTVMQAPLLDFSFPEPISLPISSPAPSLSNSGGFSPKAACDTDVDVMTRTDIQTMVVMESKDPPSMVVASPCTQDQTANAAQDVTTLQDSVATESISTVKGLIIIEDSPMPQEPPSLQEAEAAEEPIFKDDTVTEGDVVVEGALVAEEAETHSALNTEISAAEEEDANEKIYQIKQELESNPKNAELWQNLGDLQKSVRQYSEALYSYKQAVSYEPRNVDHRHRLAMGYAVEGRVEDAVRTFQEILMLNPNYGLAHATLSGYYRKMGFEDLAQKHIAIAINSAYESENEYNQACLQALCNNIEEALALLKTALENKQTSKDWAKRDPDLDNLRADPRFDELLSNYS